jgi:uncharacterized membrane protein
MPNQGTHAYKLFGVAIAYVLLTIIGVYIISRVFRVKFITTLIVFSSWEFFYIEFFA